MIEENKSNNVFPPHLLNSIVVFLYALVPVLMPKLGALDSNGPKFLAIAVLNILVFVYLVTNKECETGKEFFHRLFRNKVGIIYFLRNSTPFAFTSRIKNKVC